MYAKNQILRDESTREVLPNAAAKYQEGLLEGKIEDTLRKKMILHISLKKGKSSTVIDLMFKCSSISYTEMNS